MVGGVCALTIAGLTVVAASRPSQTPQPPQKPPKGERTNEEGERLEKVGPTMSRVVPRNTPYEQEFKQEVAKHGGKSAGR